MSKAIAIFSGGIDSTTLVYSFLHDGIETNLLTFDYGQRHKKEIESAALIARGLGLPHIIMDISTIGKQLTGSALTDDIDVPDGHYTDQVMKVTVVPNRNVIMLSIAFGVAWAQGATAVGIGVHAGDHPIYPDCRPEFIKAFEQMEAIATEGQVRLLTPFMDKIKAEIVSIGVGLGVPYEQTWSCYKGGKIHCGTCGTCVERREAFILAGVPDPTVYQGKP